MRGINTPREVIRRDEEMPVKRNQKEKKGPLRQNIFLMP